MHKTTKTSPLQVFIFLVSVSSLPPQGSPPMAATEEGTTHPNGPDGVLQRTKVYSGDGP